MKMQLVYIIIAIAAFILILLFLYIARLKGKQPEKTSRLSTVAMSLVVVGLVFGNGDAWLGYAIMGTGVILGIIDLIRRLRK